MKIDHLSYSQINTYLTCPLQYSLRYRDKIETPINESLILGSAVHDAADYHYSRMMKGEGSVDDTISHFDERWITKPYIIRGGRIPIIEWGSPEDDVRDLGRDLLRLLVTTTSLKPVATEQKFKRDLGGVQFVGVIDMIDDRGFIIDFKTKGGAWANRDFRRKEFARDLQPISYAALMGGAATVEFYFLLKTKTPSIMIERRVVKRGEVDWFVNHLLPSVAHAIESDAFYPTSSPWNEGWPCGWCGYSEMCKAWDCKTGQQIIGG